MIPVIIVALLALAPTNILLQYGPGILHQNPLPAITAEQTKVEQPKSPIKRQETPAPNLTATGVYAIDQASGQVLYAKDAASPRPIASITKVATAVTIAHRHKMDQVVVVPPLPHYQPEDEIVGLQPGESYTVHDLLAALMINSANDAADALATLDSGSNEAFSAQMNSLMGEWGIRNIHFSNPSGLQDKDNQASAQAVAQIALLALHNQDITKLVNKQTSNITSVGGRITPLKSTNQLLQNGRFTGIKTGYTVAAGECFVGMTAIQGHQIITVILGSLDRFGETQTLVDWINRTYSWQ